MTDHLKRWQGNEATGPLICCWWGTNGPNTLGNYLVVSYKVKHIPILWPRNPTPRNMSTEMNT